MTMRVYKSRRGFTLLECMMYSSLFAILAVGTMRVVGDARVIRSNARERTNLAVIAQSELDRVRSMPAAERKPGVQKLSKPEWPSGTTVEVEIQSVAAGGTSTVEVRAQRASLEGKPSVRLASVMAGGTP